MSIQKILLSFEPRRDNVLPALQEVNKELGFISKENMYRMADYFQLAPARLYGMVTSSAIIRVKPRKTLEIAVCSGAHCQMKGAFAVIAEIERFFNIKADRDMHPKVMLKTVSCTGRCGLGPLVIINGNIHGQVKPNTIDDILHNYT